MVSPPGVSPATVTAWLNSFHNDECHGALFIESLAVGGETGTLARRLRTAGLHGATVRAKSGYINGVSCLSGFVTTADGRRRCFSIMVNDLTAPLHPMVFNGLFCLSHPEVHTLSCGIAKPEDFDLHLETVELLDRADELLPPIEARLAQALEEANGAEWMRTWQDGLPFMSSPDSRSKRSMPSGTTSCGCEVGTLSPSWPTAPTRASTGAATSSERSLSETYRS